MTKLFSQSLRLSMMLLSTLYKKLFVKNTKTVESNPEDTNDLRASILIGIDKKQQYFFDIKWDYDDIDKTSNDLANLILGLTYGLFVNQIKSILVDRDTYQNTHDESILLKTIQIIDERSTILQKLLDDEDSPIVKPSEVFRPAQNVNKNI